MSEWDDVEIEAAEDLTPKRRIHWSIWAGVAALAFLLGVLWFYFFRTSEPTTEPTPVARQPSGLERDEPPSAEPETEEALDLPALDESDAFVRKLAGTLATGAEWADWLAHEDLIRTFVVVVDNIAEGVSPAKHLPFLKPAKPFQAVYDAGAFYVDPRSYDRYNLVAEVVSRLNARMTAKLYRDFKPLIQEAYREIGYPDKNFDETLARAMDHLLLTPVPDGYAELSGETVAYRYVDPRLENLTSAQKQFLRMGPTNVRKVQRKLTELKGTLRVASAE